MNSVESTSSQVSPNEVVEGTAMWLTNWVFVPLTSVVGQSVCLLSILGHCALARWWIVQAASETLGFIAVDHISSGVISELVSEC